MAAAMLGRSSMSAIRAARRRMTTADGRNRPGLLFKAYCMAPKSPRPANVLAGLRRALESKRLRRANLTRRRLGAPACAGMRRPTAAGGVETASASQRAASEQLAGSRESWCNWKIAIEIPIRN